MIEQREKRMLAGKMSEKRERARAVEQNQLNSGILKWNCALYFRGSNTRAYQWQSKLPTKYDNDCKCE